MLAPFAAASVATEAAHQAADPWRRSPPRAGETARRRQPPSRGAGLSLRAAIHMNSYGRAYL